MFYSFLFPQIFRGRGVSALILLLRIFFGVMLMLHGLDKMMNFAELSRTFPDIMGFGSYMSLILAIFAEFCCSLFLIAGLLVRLMLLPMIVTMAVAFFDIHGAMLPGGELALVYLVVFVFLYIVGPGKYSLDYLVDMRLQKEKRKDLPDY